MNQGPPMQYKDAPESGHVAQFQMGPIIKGIRKGLNENPTNTKAADGPSMPVSEAGTAKWNSIIHLLFILGVGLFLLTLSG